MTDARLIDGAALLVGGAAAHSDACCDECDPECVCTEADGVLVYSGFGDCDCVFLPFEWDPETDEETIPTLGNLPPIGLRIEGTPTFNGFAPPGEEPTCCSYDEDFQLECGDEIELYCYTFLGQSIIMGIGTVNNYCVTRILIDRGEGSFVINVNIRNMRGWYTGTYTTGTLITTPPVNDGGVTGLMVEDNTNDSYLIRQIDIEPTDYQALGWYYAMPGTGGNCRKECNSFAVRPSCTGYPTLEISRIITDPDVIDAGNTQSGNSRCDVTVLDLEPYIIPYVP